MMLYLLYRIGVFFALVLPVRFSYAMASIIAEAIYLISYKDRNAVIKNTKVVLGKAATDGEVRKIAKGVFKNFAKYLVDFFRFSKIDENYIKRFIRIEGLNHVDDSVKRGKGVILLSAHIGNWELGGFIMSILRPPLTAIVLTHQNKKINDFFTKQRKIGNQKPVEIGMGMRNCYDVLKNNGRLALLGDRDFSKTGIDIEFFGQKTIVPKGPAAFSVKLESAIVPCFMLREKDDTFRFVFEEPIFPEVTGDEKGALKRLAKKYLAVMEKYIKLYPNQWYMFRNVWNGYEVSHKPNS